MVFNGKIGIHMSYLIFYFGCKANKCSCFISKKWQEGVANFRNGAIISALVRPAVVKNSIGWLKGGDTDEVTFPQEKNWGVDRKIPLGNGTARRKRGDIFWRIT